MSWGAMPEFIDEQSVVNTVEPHLAGCSVVEVLYGAKDADGNPVAPAKDAEDGHLTWLALELDGQYEEIPSKEAVEEVLDKKKDIEKRAHDLQKSCRDTSGLEKFAELNREWSALPDYDTPKERDYASKIRESQSRYSEKLDGYKKSIEGKEALIKRAEELSTSTEWKKTSAEMKDLMTQWKELGFAGEDYQDKLWEQFCNARQAFYDAQDQHFKEKDAQRAAAKEEKTQIIAEARELTANVQNWKQTGEKVTELMDRWKKAGSAGRDDDEKLWKEFNGIRDTFYAGKKQFVKNQEAGWNAAAAKKRELIARAKEISATHDYSRENTEEMKELSKQWKEAGYAGHEQDDALWKEFCEAKDVFWNEKRAQYDARKSEWDSKKQDIVGRRKDRIENLQEQNRKLHDRVEMSSNIGQITRLNGYIAENNEEIKKLQDEIRDIENRK